MSELHRARATSFARRHCPYGHGRTTRKWIQTRTGDLRRDRKKVTESTAGHPASFQAILPATGSRATTNLATGRQRAAVNELRVGAADYRGLLGLMYLGHALGVTGARGEGQKVLAEIQGLRQSRYVPPEYIAMVYEGLGDRVRAPQWFEKAVAERSMNIWILPDQRLGPIRTDPRFENLMRRMGLSQ